MQRQKSILSFLQRPSPENQKNGGDALEGRRVPHFPAKQHNKNTVVANQATVSSTLDSSVEIRGTDTPPEKVPRQIFRTSFAANENSERPSLFSSIKHKFVRVDDKEKSCDASFEFLGNQVNGGSINVCPITSKSSNLEALLCEVAPSEHVGKGNIHNSNGTDRRGDNGCPLVIEDDDDDILGPETPGMRPLVPRLKRIQEDSCNFKDRSDCSLLDSSKRIKKDSEAGNRNLAQLSETTSKFEWLDPSRIRDANGRRPGDTLYDKRTLYIPPDALKKMSASQKQYWNVKSQYMDVMIFFKVGKFYELYELDAEIGHKELDWKITMSGVGKCRQVGISESGIDEAVQKLIARGYKVGRMEQLETSEQARARGAASVIQRKLVHVFTPSTLIDDNIGPDSVHLLAIKEGNCELGSGSTTYGFAFVDCAALKFWVGSISDDTSCAALGALLMQVSPKEVIYESHGLSREAQKALKKYTLTGSTASQLTPVQPAINLVNASEVRNLIQLKGYFKGSSNTWDQTFDGVMHHDLGLCALGGLISHLSRLMLDDVLRNGDIRPYQVYKGCLRMDGQTLVNLEIFGNNADGGPLGTLNNYLNNCLTSSGKRLLKNWICHPLKDVEQINCRLNVVEELMAHSEFMLLIAQYLRKLPDLERLLGRVKASFQSSASLVLPLIGRKVLKQRVKKFGALVKGLRVGMDLLLLLQNEGHMILSLSKVLKLPLLNGNDGIDKFLAQFEAAIESDFPNYQDHNVMDSDADILSILIELFMEKVVEWAQVCQAIDCIDVLRSFAVTASSACGAMSKPVILPLSKSTGLCQVTRGPILKIKGLWHPYALGENGELPVPNDVYLGEDTDGHHPRSLLLTGPNMGGKSTLLRATCLAVILAQLGSYVPCEMCVLSLADIIFTRLGSTDRIMTGESTFFIECTETASVLQNATQDSLVLLDELGRGTSTFDGYAIAYAVFRHLVEKVNCRLLFATHYHPLTKEFAHHPHVILQHMACTFKSKSENSSEGVEDLVFLYRLTFGACPESYGMQVALMAGIPKQVVEAASRAGQVMKESIGESFKSSERRSEFSTLHEEWLKTLLAISKTEEGNFDDNDAFDTLFCLWHEVKSSYQMGK
ncbi:DNA mismatch repair protein MSH7 isoform X1 [Camellia sinensis]|uniref:DNA mismatch repair protein MSH7 isoform X1 n=1 Tax=Camellia sinensis TaxID=4442 RepID=UPI001036CEF3|nr:DNA mismatch repair protein MSH7 isoform X1 [Camellia sinensis]